VDITSSVIKALDALGSRPAHLIADGPHPIIQCSTELYINVVSLGAKANPYEFINLQETYQQEGKLIVHLWEDVWLLNQTGVLSRIKSFLGLNQTFHARKAKLIEVASPKASQFLNAYHLQGFVKAKYHFGLLINDEVIAMASFSDLRPMKSKGSQYNSAELVRFASKDGYTVTGGLSKLIKHFLNLKQPNDLMSYADRDWSIGKGYEHLGFELTAITAPAYLYVDEETKLRYFPHRLPKEVLAGFDEQKELNLDEYLAKYGFASAFNTGNLKYHFYV
jgi:hypothetical protein